MLIVIVFAFLLTGLFHYPFLLRINKDGCFWYPRVFGGWMAPIRISLRLLKRKTRRKVPRRFYIRFWRRLVRRTYFPYFRFGPGIPAMCIAEITLGDIILSGIHAKRRK